ncbi:MAG TPA: DNA internalization-related competence protein ComEC/Rec2, partial [Thiobacillaceae bacterium]|nr:DNA internalization-related competence protein ComEC/Rec2 [Thiobacillaceae bacterium]
MRVKLLAFAAGVWLLQQQPELPDPRYLWLLPLPATLVWLPSFSDSRIEALRQAGLALLCLALGFAWAAWRADLRLADALPSQWQGTDITLSGVVAGLPDRDIHGERFDFDVERIATPGARVPQHIRLSWPIPDRDSQAVLHRINAGERWQFTVRLKRPHGTSNPDGFDPEAWLLERNIRASGYVRPKAEALRLNARVDKPMYWVQHMRDEIRQRIFATLGLDSPNAGLIAALTVGDQNAIPAQGWRIYNRTGTSHLVSISGLHVTLFAALVMWAVNAIWRRAPTLSLRLPAGKAALSAGLITAFLYVCLAGFQVPAQRTLYMLAVVTAALWLARRPRPSSTLLAALCVVLLLDPWAVLAAGFWLSFGAVAAILFVSSGQVKASGKLQAWAQAQWAVTLALAPALILVFHQVSLISPVANAFAIPVVSWVMVPLALLGIVFAPTWHAAAWVGAWVQTSLAWLAAQPWAVWHLPTPQPLATVLGLLGITWLLLPRGIPARYLGAILCLPILFPLLEQPTSGEARVEVLDVGQGTAVLIRTARHALLYDTGPAFGDSDAGERIVLPRLFGLGLAKLDGMVLTHDDLDHTGGAPAVLRDMDVDWIATSLPPDRPLLIGQHVIRCQRGLNWQWDGVRFEILNPPASAYQELRKDNNMGCVLKVAASGKSLLMTADAEAPAEEEMLAAEPNGISADVLLAGHHGSKTSSTPEFVQAVGARQVIFTMGYRNRYGHPHWSVVSRFRASGAGLYRTDRAGELTFMLAAEAIRPQGWRRAHHRYWQDPVREH